MSVEGIDATVFAEELNVFGGREFGAFRVR